ncbi:hypothetical protein K1W54_30455 [Micromonospora sp. CPCC 205371]|nr:hypothetical protein [Micromonospora sp. CPCC 205371]
MRTPAKAVMTLAAIGLAVAGCQTGTGGTGSTASPSPTPSSSGSAGGQAVECVTGDWRTTGAAGTAGSGSATAEVTGGSGVAVNIQRDGAVRADFSGMQPVTFDVNAAGTAIRGQFWYGGTANGTIRTMEGRWEPIPPIEWGDVRVTVDLTSPVKARPFDDVRLGDYVGDGVGQTGGVVDVQPFLGKGSYECRGDTLVLSPSGDNGLTWTLARA